MARRSTFEPPAPAVPFNTVADKVLGVPTLSVRLALRTDVGLRLLRKSYLLSVTGLMLLVSWIGNLHVSLSLFGGAAFRSDNDESLFWYALLVFLPLGAWQHIMRLREEKRGVEPHTYSGGDGWWYGFLPLPDKYCDIVIDPLVCFLVGAVLAYRLGCGLLGWWLMVSAACLLAAEIMRYTQAQERRRDRSDLKKEAEGDGRAMRNRLHDDGMKHGGAGATIPTGDDDELKARIAKNKLENSWAEKGEDDHEAK